MKGYLSLKYRRGSRTSFLGKLEGGKIHQSLSFSTGDSKILKILSTAQERGRVSNQ